MKNLNLGVAVAKWSGVALIFLALVEGAIQVDFPLFFLVVKNLLVDLLRSFPFFYAGILYTRKKTS